MRYRLQAAALAAILWGGYGLECSQLTTASAGSTVRIVPRERAHPPHSDPVLRIDSSLVLVPVHVTDALGAPVSGLTRRDFQVIEDGVEQTISDFAIEDAPVSVGFLFDASGSMKAKMQRATEAAGAFFLTANPEDEFFLLEFNDKPRLVVPFTADSQRIYRQVARTHPGGPTTLIDAMYLALRQMKHARQARKAIVIVSDGGDNWSRHSARELTNTLLESDTQVYAMGIFDPRMPTKEERNGPELLDKLAEATGGRQYRVDNIDSLPAISTRIGRELRSEYVLGYYSTNAAPDGKYRQVKVKLAAAEGRELHVSYRRGYYAPAE